MRTTFSLVLLEMTIYGGFVNNLSSMYLLPITQSMGVSRSTYSLVLSIRSLTYFLTGMFSSMMFLRFGYRKLVTCGLLLGSVTLVAMSFSRSMLGIGFGMVFLGICESMYSTIGVTSGASFVGYMMLVVFPQYYHMLPIGAILGSFATTMAIYVLAYDRGVSPVKMILSGMAVSAVFGAFNDMIKIFFAERLADATGFMVGSLNGVSWADFKLVLPYVAIGVFVCFFLPSKMNILMLGDEMANTLGLRVERFRLFLIAVSDRFLSINVE